MKRLFTVVPGIFIVFLFAFAFRPNPNSSPHNKKQINGIGLNSILYPLYIDNSTKNSQLDLLLSLQSKGIFLDHFKKVIFQYYYQDDNRGFTLTAYVGSRKQYKFQSKVVQLISYTTCGNNCCQIGPNVFLGDFEFIDQKDVITKLQNLSSDKIKNKYIVFYPSLKTETMNGITRTNVNYTLYTVSDLSEICTIATKGIDSTMGKLTLAPVGASTNPSPPYGGN